MTSRAELARAFIDNTDWRGADLRPLAGDASNRRYDRVNSPQMPSAVLMDAPPEKGEATRPFVAIARHLSNIGLSAPDIYAEDTEAGFLLIEDLGDDLFARVLEHSPELEESLYIAAADALIAAQSAPPPNLDPYDADAMTDTAMLVPEWYMPQASKAPFDADEYRLLVSELLQTHLVGPKVLVQRDYHAENLLWCPERIGVARVGLLDFQGAMLGHPAYDLASLLKDARRDVSPLVQASVLAHFMERTGADPTAFKASYAACSAQRNLRIFGVFTRLCVRDGKTSYAQLLPRVWRNLSDDLTHPALHALKAFVDQNIPAPSPKVIAQIVASAHG